MDRNCDNIEFTYWALVRKFESLYTVSEDAKNAFRIMTRNKKPVHQNHLRVLFQLGIRTVRKILKQKLWSQYEKENYSCSCWASFAKSKLQLTCKSEMIWIKFFYHMDKDYASMVDWSAQIRHRQATNTDKDKTEGMGVARYISIYLHEKSALFNNFSTPPFIPLSFK